VAAPDRSWTLSLGTKGSQVTTLPRISRPTLIVIVSIVVFGTSAAFFHQRTADFMGEDVFYADAARNLLQHGFYGVNGNPETTQPPGLAAILALVIGLFGYSYGGCVVAMVVFETLGFVVAYELLRRRIRGVFAGIICLVLMSSPAAFAWATRFVHACFPYFFTTMAALLCGEEYMKAGTVRSRAMWGTAFSLAVVASILIATSTIALLGAMFMVVLVTALRDRTLARTQLLKLLPVLLSGILAQIIWTANEPAPLEWSLPGYPQSYLRQLRVKDGNHPELGLATWKDVPPRVAKNVLAGSDILTQLVLRHGVNQRKVAVLILPVLLIALGWGYALWISGGTDLAAWFFAGYCVIYLLWPWTMELRFVLPVAPLACLYICQGFRAVVVASTEKPRVVGILGSIIALLALALAGQQIYGHWRVGQRDFASELILPMWLASAGAALLMAYSGRSIFATKSFSQAVMWLKRPLGVSPASRLRWIQWVGVGIVGAVILAGLVVDTRIATENIRTTNLATAEQTGPSEILALDVNAGTWLRMHTDTHATVMARSWPTVHHYAQRRVVWFPPISNPAVLMEGMMRHGVDYVVVINRESSYYLPDDGYSFEPLLANHGDKFQLVFRTPNLRIFRFNKR